MAALHETWNSLGRQECTETSRHRYTHERSLSHKCSDFHTADLHQGRHLAAVPRPE